MKKRGLSQVVSIILLILVLLVAIAIIWFFLSQFIRQEGEIVTEKQRLLSVDISVDTIPVIDQVNPDLIKLRLRRGAEDLELKDAQEILVSDPLDIALTIDLSDSMLDISIPETETTKLMETIDSTSNFINDILVNSDPIVYENKKIGVIKFEKFDNERLIDPPGFVNNANANDLISELSSWDESIVGPATCICCGIVESINNLDGSENPLIILTSDGIPNQYSDTKCDTDPFPPDEEFEIYTGSFPEKVGKYFAIKAAEKAKQKGIAIHTIGFGAQDPSELDEVTLQKIAEITGGSYFHANLGSLSAAFSKILKTIKKTYKKNFNYLRIIFYTESETFQYDLDKDFPGPLELKTYNIPISKLELPADVSSDDFTKIEIYPVVVLSTGKQLIGQPLDIYNLKNGIQ